MQSYYDLHLNSETARYIFRILAAKIILSEPQKYGFVISPADNYPLLASRQIVVDTSIDDLSAFAAEQGVNYKMLRFFYPWLRSDRLTNVAGKKYIIRIPEEGGRNIKKTKE